VDSTNRSLAGPANAAHLRDAARYITALPKKEEDAPEWQAAIEALMLARISHTIERQSNA